MGNINLFFGLFCILLGASFSIYRIIKYPSRVREQKGIFFPGIPAGSLEDKLLYIGSPVAVFIGGIYLMVRGVFL